MFSKSRKAKTSWIIVPFVEDIRSFSKFSKIFVVFFTFYYQDIATVVIKGLLKTLVSKRPSVSWSPLMKERLLHVLELSTGPISVVDSFELDEKATLIE